MASSKRITVERKDEVRTEKLTPDEIHALAIAPLPAFNVYPKSFSAGCNIKNYESRDTPEYLEELRKS